MMFILTYQSFCVCLDLNMICFCLNHNHKNFLSACFFMDMNIKTPYLLISGNHKLAYKHCTAFPSQNFLDNFPSSDIMVFVARTFLLFQMITVYPLLGYLVRVQMMGQLFGNHYPR